ncbi:TPA: hypothetical protein ACY4PQ_001732 [Vibrio parahaemolyticus]
MKKIVILTVLLVASYANANWDINQNGVAIQPAERGELSAAILEYTNKTYSVSIVQGDPLQSGMECDESKSVREVNGTPVKVYIGCDNGMQRVFGVTDKGREFIVNEFKTKNSVVIGSAEFSAIGFSAALQKLKQRKAWEKNAL